MVLPSSGKHDNDSAHSSLISVITHAPYDVARKTVITNTYITKHSNRNVCATKYACVNTPTHMYKLHKFYVCVHVLMLTLFRNDGPRKIANSNGMFRRTTAVRIVLVFAKCRLHSPPSPYGMSVEHCISKRKRRRGKSDVHKTKPLFKASGLDKIAPCFTMKLQHCLCL